MADLEDYGGDFDSVATTFNDKLKLDPSYLSAVEQTEQALQNLFAIVKGAGSSKDRILKTTVYVSDIGLWDRVNAVYAKMFGDHRPARAVVPTRDLHFGFQIEIEAIAALD